MTSRHFLLLLAAALLAVGAAFWLSARHHATPATATGEAILAPLRPEVNDVTRLRLAKGDGSEVTLVRRPKDWIVEERGYPADSGRVRKLLLDLAALAVVEEKTHDPKNYGLLGVEDPAGASNPGVLVEITAPRAVPALIVGKPAGAKAVYVRRRGAAPSFLAAPQLTLDTAPKGWLARNLLDIKPDRVREVTVTVPGAPAWTASRATRGDSGFSVAPIPKGRALASPSAADAAGSTLAVLDIDDVRRVAEESAGGEAAPYHAVVRSFDGLVVELVGRADGEHRYLRLVAHVDAAAPPADPAPVEAEAAAIAARTAGFEFELAPYKFDAIFRPLDTLLAKPPEKQAKLPSAFARPSPD